MKRVESKKKGTARMIELGYQPLQLWLSPHMQTWLNQAAAEENIPRARLALNALSFSLAQRQLKKGE